MVGNFSKFHSNTDRNRFAMNFICISTGVSKIIRRVQNIKNRPIKRFAAIHRFQSLNSNEILLKKFMNLRKWKKLIFPFVFLFLFSLTKLILPWFFNKLCQSFASYHLLSLAIFKILLAISKLLLAIRYSIIY